MTAPATALEVVRFLGQLSRELDQIVKALKMADLDATEKRAAYDLAYSRAFLAATGAVEQRKHLATVEVHRQRLEADVADTVVRHLRRQISAIETRIGVGRSYGTTVRAELALGGMDGQP